MRKDGVQMADDIDPKYSSGTHCESIEEALGRIADLAEELSNWADPEVAQKVEELIELIDAFHRSGISSLMEIIEADKDSESLIEKALLRSEIKLLLSAYEVMSDKCDDSLMGEIVKDVLSQLHPLVQLHAGDFELVEYVHNKVTLKLLGTCVDCPSARTTFKGGIEDLFRQRGKEIQVVLLPEDVVMDASKDDLVCGIPSDGLIAHRGTPIKLRRKVLASDKQESTAPRFIGSGQTRPDAIAFGGQ